MTVIDTSALVAIIKTEADADALRSRLGGGTDLVVPASCYVEAVMVLSRFAGGRADLDKLLEVYDVAILACDERQARLAADAFERYGRGGGHPAALNFGDCLAYAAAGAHGAPLLFKGADFGHTDVVRA